MCRSKRSLIFLTKKEYGLVTGGVGQETLEKWMEHFSNSMYEMSLWELFVMYQSIREVFP